MTEDDLRRSIDDPRERAEVGAQALASAFLSRIERLNPGLNAILTPTPEVASADARRVEAARAAGRRLPLDGMPIVLKDNIDLGGVRCTIGSKLFLDRVAERDAFVVERLRAAGAVVVAKAHLHEFAYGATSNSALGAARNPWDPSRIPGGSSGGSGAALAADLAIGALGTDTGGSIRMPSAFNGVTGLRPTLGAVSNAGVYPCALSLDTVGPMARSATDVRALFASMVAFDPADPSSCAGVENATRPAGSGIRGLRVGIVDEFFFDDADPEIVAGIVRAADVLSELGASVLPFGIAGIAEAYQSCTLLMRAEATALHDERIDDESLPIGDDVRGRLRLGRDISGIEIARALSHRMRWRRELATILSADVDVLLTPSIAVPTPSIEGTDMLSTTTRFIRMTLPWSFAGLPAISIPCGFRSDGMPIGMQIAAAPWRDDLAIDVADAYQSATDWHRQRPAHHLATH
ncbi:MAG: amidase [Candidatus Eremiobacteraeota bacterium]|nr:amidase [Candidatus Eremiobacteraeota bacterium]